MEGVVKLRKLTKLSTMPDGAPGGGYKVGNILESMNIKQLIRVYYLYDRISFVDELLEEIGIHEDIRISKPGKDLDMYKKVVYDLVKEFNSNNDTYFNSNDDLTGWKKKQKKKQNNNRLVKQETNIRDSRKSDSMRLRDYNHGHRI